MRTLMGQVHAALETPIPGVTSDMLEDGVVTTILGYLTNHEAAPVHFRGYC